LGKYNGDFEWSEGFDVNLKHHSQFYANGTECDLTGNMRKTEVKVSHSEIHCNTGFHWPLFLQYVCSPQSLADVIVQVSEPSSCEYVLTVVTAKLCALKRFRPPPSAEPATIRCQPILTEAEYAKFELYEREKQRLKEVRRKRQKEEQRLKMLEAVGDDDELRGVDLNTDDGQKKLEAKFQERMADALVAELDAVLSGQALMGNNPLSMHSLDMFMGKRRFVNQKDEFLDMINGVSAKRKAKQLMQETLTEMEKQKKEPEITSDKAFKDKEEASAAELLLVKNEEKAKGDMANLRKEHQELANGRRVRSDHVSQEDLIDDFAEKEVRDGRALAEKLKKNPQLADEAAAAAAKSLEDIVAETEIEVGARLDPQTLEAAEEAAEGDSTVGAIKQLMKKLENVERQIEDVNKEIVKVQDFIDESGVYDDELDYPADVEDDGFDGREHYKHDGKTSVKKDLSQQEEEDDFLYEDEVPPEVEVDYDYLQDESVDDNVGEHQVEQEQQVEVSGDVAPIEEEGGVRIKVTQLGAVGGHGDEGQRAAEERLSRKLENVIKSKLAAAGLDTVAADGRQIEVRAHNS